MTSQKDKEDGDGDGEVETSEDAAKLGKQVLVTLVDKLITIATEYEKKSGKSEKKINIADVVQILGSSKGKDNMVEVFSEKLSLTEKLQFSRSWAASSNHVRMIEGFYSNSKPHWKKIEAEDDKFFMGDVHLFSDIPESGALIIKTFWNTEGLLSKENKKMIFKHFNDMIYYAKMWQEIKEEEELEENYKE